MAHPEPMVADALRRPPSGGHVASARNWHLHRPHFHLLPLRGSVGLAAGNHPGAAFAFIRRRDATTVGQPATSRALSSGCAKCAHTSGEEETRRSGGAPPASVRRRPGAGVVNFPAKGRAAGGIILLGEHAVAYGRPALVAGLDLGVEVQLTDTSGGPQLEADLPEVADDPQLASLLERAAAALGLEPSGFAVRVRSELPPGVGLG